MSAISEPQEAPQPASGFWRTDSPVIRDGQVVTGGMFPSQREWWDLPNFVRLFVGGYGSGKTMALCKRMIALALHNAPAPVAIVSPSYPLARQTTIETTCTLLEGKRRLIGSGDFWWNYNKTTHVFEITHKGRTGKLVVYSGDNPLSLRGFNLGAAGIDEPFIQDQEVFDQMVARVRHPDATRREINLCGTPEQLNWGYELVEGEMRDKHDVGFVRGSTRENEAVGESYLNRLVSMYDDKLAAAFVEGQFVHLGTGLVYYGFDATRNVQELGPVPDGVLWGCGMDFNVDPMAAVVFYRSGDHMHVVDEIELPNSDTPRMCGRLKDLGYWDRGLREVFPDPAGVARHTSAGRSDHQHIRDAGFTVLARPSHPAIRDRENAVNRKLSPAGGGAPTLTIEPRCQRLRKYLLSYTHELRNRANQKRMSHLLDALGYAVELLYPILRGVVLDEHI